MRKEQKQNLTTEDTPPENRGKFKRLFDAFKVRASYFCRETFRRHTKEEYREFVSRGHTGKDEVNRVYPWVYMRALFVLFILYAFVVLVLLITSNTIAYPTVLLFGGIFLNVPLLICLYELYTRRDLKFSTLVIVMIVGGVISVSLSEIGYAIYDGENIEWFSPFWTGILEEFSKAVVAVAAIVLLKKRNPYVCFLIAAAVATGFSISEDMGYVFVYARSSGSYAGIDLQYGVAVSMARAVVSLCTHIMWTGLIGWAYAKFKWPFVNPKFWAVAIFSVLLHSVWDFSLNTVAMTFIRIGLAALVAVPVVLIVIKSRKPDIPAPLRLSGEQLSFDLQPQSAKLSHKANLYSAAYIAAAVLFFIASVTVPFGTKNVTIDFSTEEEFISYIQNGLTFESDWERGYDEAMDDYAYAVEDGFKTQAVQKVESGGYAYYYYYYFTRPDEEEADDSEPEEDSGDTGETPEQQEGETEQPEGETEGGTEEPEQQDGETEGGTEEEPEDEPVEEDNNLPAKICLEFEDELYSCGRVIFYGGAMASEDGTYSYLSYYWLNSEVISWTRSGTSITVTVSETQTYGYAGEITLLVFTSLCIVGAVATFIRFRYKASKLKKLELAQNAQSGKPENEENNENNIRTVDGGSDKKE